MKIFYAIAILLTGRNDLTQINMDLKQIVFYYKYQLKHNFFELFDSTNKYLYLKQIFG